MSGVTRRKFLTLSAGAAALALDGCLGSNGDTCDQGAACTLPAPQDAPFDTVVVLMLENRSFDHMLGWLPGANGVQQGLTYVDNADVAYATWPLGNDVQGCNYEDPCHTWPGIAKQYADGRCDGFLKTGPLGDTFPISYYVKEDLPILSVLATSYTTFDNYFCSMMGPTWENRLYQLTGTTQVDMADGFPESDDERPCTIPTAIFDRVREAGLTTGYYHHGEPMTGLFRSKKYDDISYPIARFYDDARAGRLPNVVFVDPDYTDCSEDLGRSNDYHHRGSVLLGEEFVASVHNALASSPQWNRMVFVLNFDEHGGFYDHVPPPACEDDTLAPPDKTFPKPGCQDDALPPDAKPFPNLKRLGFRVPAIAMGPFAPRKIEHSGPYEHCSILRMIEWRWGLAPLRLRDATANNLAVALDFTIRRDPVVLPPFKAPPPLTGQACNAPPTDPKCV
jgi:phospholipase C